MYLNALWLVAGLNLVIWKRSRILKVLSDDLTVLSLSGTEAAPWTMTPAALAEEEIRHQTASMPSRAAYFCAFFNQCSDWYRSFPLSVLVVDVFCVLLILLFSKLGYIRVQHPTETADNAVSAREQTQPMICTDSAPRPPTTMAPLATLEYASDAPQPLIYPRLAKHHLLPTSAPDYLRLILTSKVYEILKETPLVLATNLSAKLGNEIWLKREDLQKVFSFKIRGAYNFMAGLSDEERWKGVITCSAG